jgi:hypothetical protein
VNSLWAVAGVENLMHKVLGFPALARGFVRQRTANRKRLFLLGFLFG